MVASDRTPEVGFLGVVAPESSATLVNYVHGVTAYGRHHTALNGVSMVQTLSNGNPEKTMKYRKRVTRVAWRSTNSPTQDGHVVVILTSHCFFCPHAGFQLVIISPGVNQCRLTTRLPRPSQNNPSISSENPKTAGLLAPCPPR